MRYALCALVLSATAVCFSGEEKAPVPEKAAIAAAEKAIREMFKADYAKATPSDRSALVDKLVSQGIEEQKDLASKYVLLRDARDLAAATGDAAKAVKAVVEMAKAFAVDVFAEKTAALAKTEVCVRTPDAAEPLAREYAALADEALAADKHDIALKALGKANTAAQTAKNVPLVNQLREKAQKTQTMQREYAAASTALKTLNDKPDDPAANLAVAKYLCFFKEVWEVGLPYLAKGSDSALKAMAEKELAKPTNVEEQAALADGWWATGEKQHGVAKLGCMARASHWDEQAGPKLTGIARTKAIAQIDAYDKAIGRLRMNPMLTPEEQIKSAVERMKAANPGYDGKVEQKVEGGRITWFSFQNASKVRNVAPLRGMTVEFLSLLHTSVSDIRPLAEVRFTNLDIGGTLVRDLSPLRGLGIKFLIIRSTLVTDLSPLKDSPVQTLLLGDTPVTDLTPVTKLPLRELEIVRTNVTDLSCLQGMTLERIALSPKNISKGWDVLRNMRTLAAITPEGTEGLLTTEEFWKKYDAGELRVRGDSPDKKTK